MVKIALMGASPGHILQDPLQSLEEHRHDLYVAKVNDTRQYDSLPDYYHWLNDMMTDGVTPEETDFYDQLYQETLLQLEQRLERGENLELHVTDTLGAGTVLALAAVKVRVLYPDQVRLVNHPQFDRDLRPKVAGYRKNSSDTNLYFTTGDNQWSSSWGQNAANSLVDRISDQTDTLNRDVDGYGRFRHNLMMGDRSDRSRHWNAQVRQVIAQGVRYRMIRDCEELLTPHGSMVNGTGSSLIRNALHRGKTVQLVNTSAIEARTSDRTHTILSDSASRDLMTPRCDRLKPEYLVDGVYQSGQQWVAEGIPLNSMLWDDVRDVEVYSQTAGRTWHYRNELREESDSVKKDSLPRDGYVYHSKYDFYVGEESWKVDEYSLYVTGSIYRSGLTDEVKDVLDFAMQEGQTILVSDSRGLDRSVQDYLKRADYDKVCVYTLHASPKNCLDDNWEVRHVALNLSSDERISQYVTTSGGPTRAAYDVLHGCMVKDSSESLVLWEDTLNTNFGRRNFETPQMDAMLRTLERGHRLVLHHQGDCLKIANKDALDVYMLSSVDDACLDAYHKRGLSGDLQLADFADLETITSPQL